VSNFSLASPRLCLGFPAVFYSFTRMATSIPLAAFSLLACAIGCLASPGGIRPTAGLGTSNPPAQGQAASSAGSGGNQVSPNPNVPVMLPSQMGEPPRDSGDDPEFPRELRHTGLTYVVHAKVCVSKTGTVDSVSILKGSDMALVQNVVNAVKGWRHRPLIANNVAVPFCYFANFEFKTN